VQPVLDAANAVIALAAERHAKELGSTRRSRQKPGLARIIHEPGGSVKTGVG
jgi:DNA helicase-2/ATP-dependent DNA helicase PcrA